MKKTIYGLLVLCAACFAFTSCGDDDDNNLGTHSEQPGVASAGVYTGTWSEYSSDGKPTAGKTELPGTVEIVNGPAAYTAIVKTTCEGLKDLIHNPANNTEAGEQQVNCVWSNDNFSYYTQVKNGTLDAVSIDGTCQGDVMTINVQKNIKSGRQTKVYIFKFQGTKKTN